VLGVEEVVALLKLLELLDGVEIDWTDAFEFLAQFIDDFHDKSPVWLGFLAGNDDTLKVHLVIAIGDGGNDSFLRFFGGVRCF
jgi:hypothetical protein